MGEIKTVSVSVTRSRVSGRDNAIDFTRGVCIISMICAHIAGGSNLHAVTHALVWVDGSMGFVFLAGVVLGMVRRKTTESEGPGSTAVKTLKRTRLIYGAHVGITLLALLVGTGGVSATTYGWPESILLTFLLALNPPLSILSLWVVLLLLAAAALYAFGKGYLWPVFWFSLAVYAAGKAVPFETNLPGQGSDQAFQIDAWQFLFILGICIGWAWRTEQVQRVINSRLMLVVSVVFLAAAAVLAHFTIRMNAFAGSPLDALVRETFVKLDLGPGAILMALAVALVIYRTARRLEATIIGPALSPIRMLGTRSLDSYIISTMAAILLPAVLPYDHESVLAQVLAVGIILACIAWAYARKALRRPYRQ